MVPAREKSPPTNRCPAPSAASALTWLFIPEPKADQALPSHLAMKLAVTPPAVMKYPPAYRLVPLAASAVTKGLETAPIPEPKADQALPSHLAMPLATTVPTDVKEPPMYTLPPPSTAMALTPESGHGMPGFKLTQLASLNVGSIRTG